MDGGPVIMMSDSSGRRRNLPPAVILGALTALTYRPAAKTLPLINPVGGGRFTTPACSVA